MDRQQLAEVIVEEGAPAEPADRPVRWLLPAISVAIALVFGLVAVGRTGLPALGAAAPAGARVPAAAVDEGALPVDEAALAVGSDERALPPPPRLPSAVATLVHRSHHTAIGGLISRDHLDATGVHHVYRLVDGRRIVLQQYSGELAVFPYPGQSVERVTVRGREAIALGPRGLGTAPTIWWREGPASYRLWSARLRLDELIAVAERLASPTDPVRPPRGVGWRGSSGPHPAH